MNDEREKHEQKANLKCEIADAATEGAMNQVASDIIDDATRQVCEYVNKSIGVQALAKPDNEIRRILTALLVSYDERRNLES